MFSAIITAENLFNQVLPVTRLQYAAPEELVAAGREWSDAVWALAEQLGPMPLTVQQLTDGNRLVQNPVFICGVHRSGTTLLKDMLDGHPELVVLPSEGTFYTNLEQKLLSIPEREWAAFMGNEWLRRLANPINQAPYWLLGRSGDDGSPYVVFARYVMAWWQTLKHEPGTQWPHMAVVLAYASCTDNLLAKYWVDKTPTNERFLHRIRREIPSAKIIHMLRDPVATLTSRRQMEPSISLRNALKFLKMSFRIASKQNDSHQYMVIRYEDLCNEPQLKTGQLADFLGIEVSETLVKPSVGSKASQANSSFNDRPEPGLILKPDQHKQQTNLSATEQQLITAVMGRSAKKYDYQLPHIAFIPCVLLKLRFGIIN
jgi:hypothetical protein